MSYLELFVPESYVRLIETLASVGVCVSSLEWLSRPQKMKDSGLFSWAVSRRRYAFLARGLIGRLTAAIMPYPGFLIILAIQTTSAVAFLLPIDKPPATRGILDGLIALTFLVTVFRTPHGMDGADQMSLVTFGALALGRSTGTESGLGYALWFIAAQLIASYVIAGVAKLLSPEWRSGRALLGILSTATYGLGRGLKPTDRSVRVAAALCWVTILWESSFFLVLFGGWHVVIGYLILGAIFHINTAFTMGLNTFLWSFVAAYPAILFIAGTHNSS